MKKLLLNFYFSGEDSEKFVKMLNQHRKNPFKFTRVYEATNKRDRFTLEFKEESEIFHLGFLWKDTIQLYEEKDPS